MKSILLLLLGVSIYTTVVGQDSVAFIGHWQYFDNAHKYHELVIEDTVGYIYGDSIDPALLKINANNDRINWEKLGTWTLIKNENEQLLIKSPNGTIRLYKLPYDEDNVKSFYKWCNNPKRTGNGYRIFIEDFNRRKTNLKLRMQNSR